MMLIAAIIPPGTHPVIQVCGGSAFLCVFNYDTLISSGIAIVLTLALGLGVSYRLTHGTPGKLQSVLELLLSYVRNLTSQMVSDEGTDFIVPIAATIFIFVLLANWLDFFPLTAPVEPAAADINLTLAMAIVVIVIVQWYSIHVLGFRGYLRRFTKPFELPLIARVAFTPLNIIEEIQKPLSLGAPVVRQHLRWPRDGVPAHARVHGVRRVLGDSDGAVTDLGHPAGGMEALRRLPHRHDPGVHLHATDHHLFRHGP